MKLKIKKNKQFLLYRQRERREDDHENPLMKKLSQKRRSLRTEINKLLKERQATRNLKSLPERETRSQVLNELYQNRTQFSQTWLRRKKLKKYLNLSQIKKNLIRKKKNMMIWTLLMLLKKKNRKRNRSRNRNRNRKKRRKLRTYTLQKKLVRRELFLKQKKRRRKKKKNFQKNQSQTKLNK